MWCGGSTCTGQYVCVLFLSKLGSMRCWWCCCWVCSALMCIGFNSNPKPNLHTLSLILHLTITLILTLSYSLISLYSSTLTSPSPLRKQSTAIGNIADQYVYVQTNTNEPQHTHTDCIRLCGREQYRGTQCSKEISCDWGVKVKLYVTVKMQV